MSDAEQKVKALLAAFDIDLDEYIAGQEIVDEFLESFRSTHADDEMTNLIAKAVEGSMEKRAAVLYPGDGELKRSIRKVFADNFVAAGTQKFNDLENELMQLFSIHLQAAVRAAEDRGITKGRRIQAEATLEKHRHNHPAAFGVFMAGQVDAWRHEEQQLKQEGES